MRKLVVWILALVAAIVPTTPARATVVVEHCQHVRTASDDPIVYPGIPGASHLHEFFGNASVDAFSTAYTLQSSGLDGCDIAGDHSAYWNPAIYEDSSTTPLRLSHVGPYWKDNGVPHVSPAPFGMAVVARGWDANVFWACTAGGHYTSPPDCTGKGAVKLIVNFPSCWDGIGPQASHFAYPVAVKTCPTGFPVRIAQLNLHVDLPLTGAQAVGHTFTCALYPGDPTDPATRGPITTFHADFFDAFDDQAMAGIVAKLNA